MTVIPSCLHFFLLRLHYLSCSIKHYNELPRIRTTAISYAKPQAIGIFVYLQDTSSLDFSCKKTTALVFLTGRPYIRT